jgi:integrase
MFTRTRYQYGTLEPKQRKNGGMIWEFRFYETNTQGGRERRSTTVGSVAQYPTESAVRKSPAVQSLLLRINQEAPQAGISPPSFGTVIAKYEEEEMPERYSTSAAYKSYIKNYIRPRWSDVPLDAVKSMAVEDWLKRLSLAPKSKTHIRSLMHTIFQCAERWELTKKNPMRLVRVKGGSKRLQVPRILSPEEFCSVASLIIEPYQTQVWVAGCLGLRASEIMPLQWSDFDFSQQTLLIQRSSVHGKTADVKTEYSRDRVPLDPALAAILLKHRERWCHTPEAWVFANPVTGRPYHQDGIQQNYIRKAGLQAGLGDGIGWHTFRHSYRSWLDDTGAPMSVQKELMRHASIQTTMNIYGKAMSGTKREAHSRVVKAVLLGRNLVESADPNASTVNSGS